jgi:hypothetical protein
MLCVVVPNVAAPFSLLGVVRTIKELRHQPQQLQSQQQQQQHRQEQQILSEKLFSHNFVLFFHSKEMFKSVLNTFNKHSKGLA